MLMLSYQTCGIPRPGITYFMAFLINNYWVSILRTKSKQRKNRVHAMPRQRPNYLHSGTRSEDSENVQVSGLNVQCQRRSRERRK